jgi:hypothetical protein
LPEARFAVFFVFAAVFFTLAATFLTTFFTAFFAEAAFFFKEGGGRVGMRRLDGPCFISPIAWSTASAWPSTFTFGKTFTTRPL